MRAPSNVSSPVVEPAIPIFGSSRATSNPGVSASTTKAEIPVCPASGSVFANTVYSPATAALVMNRFEPSRTYSSPSRRAVVRIAAESEPEPASVRAYAVSISPEASEGRKRAFCSSVPASLSPSDPSSWAARMSPLVAQTLETSSIAISERRVPVPVPPYRVLEEQAEDSVLPVQLDDVPGKLVRLVDLGCARCNALARERANELADLELLVAQRLPGHGLSLSLWDRARPSRP